MKESDSQEALEQAALAYHAEPAPGKIAIAITKPCETQEQLSLAYSPGVAAPVQAIAAEPALAYRYTAKGNLVAVISDGTAVLGLGKVGPLASKPVMEGKAILFKRFADIDVFDLELEPGSIEEIVDTVARIAPTFGGINLEDIAAPACFEIERQLQQRLAIPVFHDDQHGTAIIIAAGLLNALELQEKRLDDVRIVCLGAGAAGIAAMHLLLALGARRENLLLVDRRGVVHAGREDLNEYKKAFAVQSGRRTLAEALDGADAFIGVSGGDLLGPQLLAAMAPRPVLFALANPNPEIRPELAHSVRDDLIIATGRSDYPNQVNNVLGFPYIFRGALDVQAATINRAMQIAVVEALRELAHEPVPAAVLKAYGLSSLSFGRDYIIPKPFDPRLIEAIPPRVARAAIDSGVARSGWPAHYPPG
jgi:malate dehydrogenase (oxaloacetate-decarboxylating)(NADP+)